METKQIHSGIELHFPPEEGEAAQIVERACRQSIRVIHDVWGLAPPARCRVYVTNSWLRSLFQGVPWYRSVLLALLLPIVFRHLRRQWKRSGGWTYRFRRRPVVGVKPPRLIAQSDTSIGQMIYIKQPDLNKQLEFAVCHEMTHACSAHLRLPMWLNEGIAMVSVERLYGGPRVRTDTLRSLNQPGRKRAQGKYRDLLKMKKQEIAYHYVRGYWMTRFLMDAHPGLLSGPLKKRHRRRSMEEKLAFALGISRKAFWDEIDRIVVEHFRQQSDLNNLPKVTAFFIISGVGFEEEHCQREIGLDVGSFSREKDEDWSPGMPDSFWTVEVRDRRHYAIAQTVGELMGHIWPLRESIRAFLRTHGATARVRCVSTEDDRYQTVCLLEPEQIQQLAYFPCQFDTDVFHAMPRDAFPVPKRVREDRREEWHRQQDQFATDAE